MPIRNEIGKNPSPVPGTSAFLYRGSAGWRQYEPVRINGNEVDVLLSGGGICTFPISSVRLYHNEVHQTDVEPEVVEHGVCKAMGETSTSNKRMIIRSMRRKLSMNMCLAACEESKNLRKDLHRISLEERSREDS